MITIFCTQSEGLERLLKWPLWIARTRGGPVTVLVPSSRATTGPIRLGLAGEKLPVPGATGVVTAVREALDAAWGPESWCNSPPDGPSAQPAPGEPTGTSATDGPTPVTLLLIPAERQTPHVLEKGNTRGNDLLILSTPRREGEDSEQAHIRRHIMARLACEVVLLRTAKSAPKGQGVLVAAAPGPHAQAALRLAADLTDHGHGPATALYVEPPVGTIAEGVGENILSELVKHSLLERAPSVAQRVVIDDKPHTGIIAECKRSAPELLLLGCSKQNSIGQRLRGTIGMRVQRSTDETSMAVVRAALPLRARTLRALGLALQSGVPQMSREARIDMVERVQSNSQWDFDFSALMCLSTLIAAVGLVQSSAAVVIGAMLVAPLMTPMLGMGLAMAHGNPYLVRATGRSILLGFLTAFVLAFLLGILHPTFFTPTPEMLQRNWPGLLDLFVAFVSGIAAAYASSRPNLLAALPGVAIAAALVPPIATTGLALAARDVDLALGAALLFAVNMVAIVLASWITLWSVGLRGEVASRSTRVVGGTLIAVVLALGIQLSFAPPVYRPAPPIPEAAIDRVEAMIDGRWRLTEVALDKLKSPAELLLRLGGPESPPAEMAQELLSAIEPLIDREIDLRLRYQWAVSASSSGR